MNAAAPTYESVLAHLSAASSTLVPAERRVAQVLIRQLHRLEEYSAIALAQEATCSAATVVRACQRMGYSGFQQLRLLSIRFAAGSDAAQLPGQQRVARTVSDQRLQQVFSRAITELRAIESLVDRQEFDRATKALAAASRILVLPTEGSVDAARQLAADLSGWCTVIVSQQLAAQQAEVKALQHIDACLVVGAAALEATLAQLVHGAGQRAVPIIAVTNSPAGLRGIGAEVVLSSSGPGLTGQLQRSGQGVILLALAQAVQAVKAAPGPSPTLSTHQGDRVELR